MKIKKLFAIILCFIMIANSIMINYANNNETNNQIVYEKISQVEQEEVSENKIDEENIILSTDENFDFENEENYIDEDNSSMSNQEETELELEETNEKESSLNETDISKEEEYEESIEETLISEETNEEATESNEESIDETEENIEETNELIVCESLDNVEINKDSTFGTNDEKAYISTNWFDNAGINKEDVTKIIFECGTNRPSGNEFAINSAHSNNSLIGFLNGTVVTLWTDKDEIIAETGVSLFEDFKKVVSIENFDKVNFSEVTDMSYMFCRCTKLTDIDFSNFNTSNVTNMSNMFKSFSSYRFHGITFDTSNVTDMSYMFSACGAGSQAIEIDLTGINTKKVINMSHMFEFCMRIRELDLTCFDTSNVTDMSYMFHEMEYLRVLDLSSFDTSKVTNMEEMLTTMGAINTIYASELFTTESVSFNPAYFVSKNVKGGFGTQPSNEYNKLNNGEENDNLSLARIDSEAKKGFLTAKGPFIQKGWAKNCPIPIEQIETIIFYNGGNIPIAEKFTIEIPNGVSTLEGYYSDNEIVIRSCINGDRNKIYALSGLELFSGFSSLKKIKCFDILDFSYVNSFEKMFYDCASLTNIDLSTLDTSNIINMESMFENCIELEVLDLKNFDTEKVENTKMMFKGAISLTTIYATDKLVFPNVSDANSENMFVNCEKLVGGCGTKYDTNITDKQYAKIDKAGQKGYFTLEGYVLEPDAQRHSSAYISSNWFDNVEKLSTGFVNKIIFKCGGEEPDGTKFDIKSTHENNTLHGYITPKTTGGYKTITLWTPDDYVILENGNSLFRDFYFLEYIENLDLLDTSECTDMSEMFMYDYELKSLDLSNFDTSNVTTMNSMFTECESIEELDLTSFNTEKVTEMLMMFDRCISIKTIDLSSFNTNKLYRISSMFHDCSNLSTIYATDKLTFNGESDLEADNMFEHCYKLVGGAGTTYSQTHRGKEYAKIDKAGQKGYFTLKNTTKIVDNNPAIYINPTTPTTKPVSSGGSGGGVSGSMQVTNNTVTNSKSIVLEVSSNTSSWTKDEKGKWHLNINGNSEAKNTWVCLNVSVNNNGNEQTQKSYYFFNNDGTMHTGWLKDSFGGKENWYCMNTEGQMLTGYQIVNDKTYYFTPVTTSTNVYGSMLSNQTTPEGFMTLSDGQVVMK